MKTVRQQILEYLETHRVASAEAIARAFKMSSANARYHLSVLIDEGAVEVSGVSPEGNPGRPRQRYSPTRHTHRHNLDHLADALLAEKQNGAIPGAEETWPERVAGYMWAPEEGGREENRTPLQASAQTSLTQRLAQVVRRLNLMNYDARWEAHAQAPHVIFGHCPYAAIIDKHPQLCQIDALILQKALGLPVSQQVKLGKDAHGLLYCVFVLQANKR
ncbi:MAG: helix-turn-helix transcriptional regulator [Chloroflexota bacterium]